VTTAGEEHVLHSFGGRSDGAYPAAALYQRDNNLYGITSGGGANGDGTVFTIQAAGGSARVLHNFTGVDGAAAQGTLIDVDAMLYGTTYLGGATDNGTVFEVKL